MRRDLYTDLLEQEQSHWWHKAKRHLVRVLVKKYILEERPKILDVGCGTGMIMGTLRNLGEVWGIDNQDEALKFCNQKGIEKVKKGDAERLPFRQNLFDCLIALDLLEHTDHAKSLKEFNRVLKPNGKLILTVPAYPWMWGKWDEILGHKRRYTAKTLAKLLRKNHFSIIKISYLYSFLLIPAYIVRKIKGIFFKKHYPSDFLISNTFINRILGSVAKMERFYFLKKDVPFGLTVVVVANKEKDK